MIFDAFARRLRGSPTWRKEQEHVAQLVVERPQDTIAFAAVLDLELERRGFDHAVHQVRSSLLDLVCGLVHDDATKLAVHLASQPGMAAPAAPDPQHRRSRGAMQIAATRPATEIWELLADPDGLRERDPEFGALLLHELVVRNEPVPPAATWVVDWALGAGHPLALLPPALLPVEIGLPRRLPRSGPATEVPAPGAAVPPPEAPVPLGQLVDGLGDAVPVDDHRIGAAFRDWTGQPHGRVEITGWAAGSGFPTDLPAPHLSPDLKASRVSPAVAVELLFSAAVAGGTGSVGPGGASARLRTWEAVSGIVDRPWPVPIQELADATVDCLWITPHVEDPWFEAAAGHVWLLVQTGDRLVALAATAAG